MFPATKNIPWRILTVAIIKLCKLTLLKKGMIDFMDSKDMPCTIFSSLLLSHITLSPKNEYR